jgi:hypothetical protein
MKTEPFPPSEDAFRKSGFFEQLVEHSFVSEILQEVYFGRVRAGEVLRSEIDASGYDLGLTRLQRALSDLNLLAGYLGLEKDLKDLQMKLFAERTEAIQLDGQLQGPLKIGLGKDLVGRFLSQKFNPGKINPNLLFRYASERGLLEKELTRSWPTATTANEPKS